ncbi:calmodulin binding protein PICBP isoform X1 [Panicum hallii]|uniref:calmodulin binding protein PICBP isoform X1 n=1 Tax=Panicum hallii TaxID=206008 RepID=UPI000DF4CD9E|nr:calmodulin binding protein PICBP isoform X1 [Panicum hallii]
MVQRKQARKKPKDPGAVLEGDAVPPKGNPGSRGGGMARAPLPGYMRATSCSDAKAGTGGRAATPAAPPPKREPVREKVVFTAAPPRVGRATCSSTMKGPGAGEAHACPYGYCSLKGHVHASVAPLSSFVASRRRLIKTQQSMKLKGASPFRKPNSGGGDGFFVEIRAGAGAAAPPAGSDVTCSDLSTEEVDAMVRRMEYVMFDQLSRGDDAEGRAKGSGASVDGSCGSSDVISDGSVELLGASKHRRRGEEAALVDLEDGDFGACKSDISEELDAKHETNIPEGGISDNVCFNPIAHIHFGIEKQLLMHGERCANSADSVGNTPKESSVDSISSALSGISFEDVSSDCADAASSQRSKLSIARRRKTSEEGGEQMRPFKPKPPNFLPAETGPEAEKVDLRHHMVDDRRTAEEWMVDYALRKAVKKLARAQKRKVEMLVQAFETVLPTDANEKKQLQQDGDKASFTLTRPSQACS